MQLRPYPRRVDFDEERIYYETPDASRLSPDASFGPHPFPLTSIIILTYNGLEYTQQCLDSIRLFMDLPYELILVDNASKDGTRDHLESVRQQREAFRAQDIKLILNSENLGFAKGNNQGLKEAKGEYILLLNNDVALTDRALNRMLCCLLSDEKIGMVGPRSNSVSGAQLFKEAHYHNFQELQRFAYQLYSERTGDWFRLDRLVGFCLLMKREVLEKVGFLDENFGLATWEDDDYCYRARQAGFLNYCAGDVFVHHEGAAALKGAPDIALRCDDNRRLYVHKWKDKPAPLDPDGVPESALELLRQGIAIKGQGRHEDAASTLRKAVSIAPNFPQGYYELAEAFFSSEQIEAAKVCFYLSLSMNPTQEKANAYCEQIRAELEAKGEL